MIENTILNKKLTKPSSIITCYIALGAFLVCINWASQPEKQGAQFFGQLTTHQNNIFHITAISIGHDKKTEGILVYEKPNKTDSFVKKDDTHITLLIDPKKDLATIPLDLDKITTLHIPFPHTVWSYTKEKGFRTHSYLEIVVQEKSTVSQTHVTLPTSYLIEQDTPLYYDEIGNKKAEKVKISLPAVKQLTIEGYTYEKDTSHPSCLCSQPKKQTAARTHTTDRTENDALQITRVIDHQISADSTLFSKKNNSIISAHALSPSVASKIGYKKQKLLNQKKKQRI